MKGLKDIPKSGQFAEIAGLLDQMPLGFTDDKTTVRRQTKQEILQDAELNLRSVIDQHIAAKHQIEVAVNAGRRAVVVPI